MKNVSVGPCVAIYYYIDFLTSSIIIDYPDIDILYRLQRTVENIAPIFSRAKKKKH